MQSLPPEFAEVPVKRWPGNEPPGDGGDVRRCDLDFVLHFGTGEPHGELHDLARHGVWAFHFGDPQEPSRNPPGFWEVYRRKPVTAAALTQWSKDGREQRTLHSGFFETDATSYRRNRDQLLSAAAAWPAQVCKHLRLTGSVQTTDQVKPPLLGQQEVPSSFDLLNLWWRQATASLRKQYRSLFRHQQWRIGIVDAPIEQVAGLSGGGGEMPVRWLSNPPGRFLADPFAVELEDGNGGSALLLAEDYSWSKARGRISAVLLNEPAPSQPEIIFDLPYHMSYPYVFWHDGRLFCVPETNEARQVSLYAYDQANMTWARERVLIEGRRLADSTLLQWQGCWWLFATDEEDQSLVNLHAWMAPNLRGPWREHPANPLKSDIRSSRPAGRPFVYKGALYRPAQDCSLVYGGAVAVNRVDCLTPTQFRETTVHVVRPFREWHVRDGLHTLCAMGERTVIDACQEVFVGRALKAALARKVKRVSFPRVR
ncbi:hypothetical protein OMW55_07245 [Sphingomonas sp. BN140010]|uniref:Glucosamine inositolphosphorylceramide transferase 1 N-terminal domain-containing protein n=1 Tax=Sphingomonas arvum TaxID=2992113 RepID=A0ABT3JEU3_9SPHN|nr:hypothetical protein [Sphingomonas sp. BN140010]MCW3797597.1 hypothetical protein [Sphingomonas sp. BN140010]